MIISEHQARVPQERVGEVGLSPNSREAPAERAAKRAEVLGADVREFGPFDVPPDLFDGIQVGRVRGEPFDRQPRSLARQIGGHRSALMRAEPVPDEHHAPAPEVALQGAQEADERDVGVATGTGVEVEPGAPAVPPERQRPRHGQALPVAAGMDQDGRVTARRPRPADDGLLRDPAFIFEDEPGVLALGVFFTVGQRWLTHCRMAASSRSRARRAGRCGDQLSPRRRYQT